ncbi:MAG TPA: C4-type zinc ribbon domain-containing protein [Kineosporiaceae bacterium]|nr:C4-type zinc ribbon domain-containing protein [Kineosporiaceae bacterium]
MTAAPQDQWRLLDVQDHDTRLNQLAHRRRTLPEHAEADRLSRRIRDVADELITRRSGAGDVARELNKAEADVELVRQRAARDHAKLDSGSGSAKDLQALQHEIVSLAQRQSALEDVELEVMERMEAAEAATARVQSERTRLEAELAEVAVRRDSALETIADEESAVQRARADAAAGLPAELMALYEKIREQSGGVGAARIKGRRCEGCRMELNPTDMARIRAAEQDAVLRCEDCRRILVRTPDSGL